MFGQGVNGRHDFQELLGNGRLPDFVENQDEVRDELVRVPGRVVHGHHPGGLFGRLRFEEGVMDLALHVKRQDRIDQGANLRLPVSKDFWSARNGLFESHGQEPDGRDARRKDGLNSL